jgi:outer membrane protein OmpA-like peptidoglycan-associated protein
MRVAVASVFSLGVLAATPAAQAPIIPIKPGLTVAVAYSLSDGDGESMGRVESVDANGFRLSLSGEQKTRKTNDPTGGLGSILGGPQPKADANAPLQKIRTKRTVLATDIAASRVLKTIFSGGDPPSFPGTTTMRISKAVYDDLKTKGEAAFSCECTGGLYGMAAGLGRALNGLLGGLGGSQDLKDLQEMGRLSGTIKRVEPRSMLAMIVNDARVELPVIHVRGRLGDQDSEFYFLDDPQNPMTLLAAVGQQARTQVVKISFPVETKPTPIATALAETGRAEVYGIYFDFGSATIKPESEPVLKEIADVMAKNPMWSLNVEGHTDNVGGDAYNLDLSGKRAAAVKTALSGTYKIAANRLTTAGHGASRPKETNATLEGRARNRRVELVKQ